jgi:hypothetical protein
MTIGNIEFYRAKLLFKFTKMVQQAREQLANELFVNLADDTIRFRRYRMLEQLNSYENQIIKKIQKFNTDDIADFDIEFPVDYVINRSA